ncbi:MAG: ABC transporter permease/substrate-binding protein [Phycisphaeraceae bacterium]
MNAIYQQFVGSLHQLPYNLSQHMLISVVSLVLGIVISLLLAILATRRVSLRWPLLTSASIMQTVPSIALLALVYALLLGLSTLIAQSGAIGRIQGISFITAIVALTLYSILPVMRNTVTGILGVDPALIEAARGMGMTPGQILRRVQLPLAAPVIIAGIRTATVWVVGIATLSTPVGQTSLGDFIFTGLQLQNWGAVLLGCVAAAVLAIVLDALIAALQSAAEKRSVARGIVAGLGLMLVVGGGLAPLVIPKPDHLVGAKTFDEQFILASLIRDRLNEAGFSAAKQEGLGSTIAFTKLRYNQIDCYVDYSGTIWAVQMGRTDVADADTVLAEVTRWLKAEHGIECLGKLGFENAYCLAMKRSQAQELGIRTIADLAAHASELSIGGDYEFFDRPEWKAIRNAYHLQFTQQRKFQSTLMYQAVHRGEVDVISAFSSDGRIAAMDLLVLEDPHQAIPPYDAILLVSPKAATAPGFLDALKPLLGSINDDTMRRANYQVDRGDDKRTPDQAARWIEEQIAGH